jgi:uncharacterized repeat protein (TIGR01451 family)
VIRFVLDRLASQSPFFAPEELMTSPTRSAARSAPALVPLAALLAAALFVPAAAYAAGAADANTILIDGMSNSGAARDQTEAEALGFTVEVVTDAAVWNAKTTDDFKTYKAIDLPDNFCQGPSQTAIDSRTVWAPAVTGNILIVGGDPELHSGSRAGAVALVKNGIGFAADDPGKTGLWVALGCSTNSAPVLDQFGSFTIGGQGSNSIHIVAVHPALAGLTDALLSNWGTSTHLKFEAFPESFVPLAIQLDGTAPGVLSFADGTSGTPFLLVRGSGVQAVGLNLTASASDSVEAGSDLTYTITYGNTGGDATGVVITTPVPPGSSFGSASDGGTESGGTVTWTIGDLTKGTTGLTVTYTVTANTAGTLTASGIHITDGTSTTTATDVLTTVSPSPATTTTLEASPSPSTIGQSVVLTATVTGSLHAHRLRDLLRRRHGHRQRDPRRRGGHPLHLRPGRGQPLAHRRVRRGLGLRREHLRRRPPGRERRGRGPRPRGQRSELRRAGQRPHVHHHLREHGRRRHRRGDHRSGAARVELQVRHRRRDGVRWYGHLEHR